MSGDPRRLAELFLGARRPVVFTGAGVSTESGIPDFRSPGGLWDRFDPGKFTYRNFIDAQADLVIRDKAGTVMAAVVEEVRSAVRALESTERDEALGQRSAP